MAHLYNAFRQTGLLIETWPAIDQAIERNMSLLFNGRLPETHRQISSQYFLSMKWPATVFARNHRGRRPNWHAIINKLDDIHTTSNSAKTIREYLKGGSFPEKFLHDMLKHGKSGSSKKSHGFSRLEMLTELRDSLHVTMESLEVDRVTLSRQSTKILRLIRDALKEKQGIENEMSGLEIGEVWGKWNCMTVMMIFTDTFPPRNSRHPVQLGPDSQMAMVAEVMKSSISEIKSEPAIEPFDVVAATRRDRSYYENLATTSSMQRLMERMQTMGGMGH